MSWSSHAHLSVWLYYIFEIRNYIVIFSSTDTIGIVWGVGNAKESKMELLP